MVDGVIQFFGDFALSTRAMRFVHGMSAHAGNATQLAIRPVYRVQCESTRACVWLAVSLCCARCSRVHAHAHAQREYR